MPPTALGAAGDGLGAGEMEQIHRAARGVGQHERLGDRELLGQRWPRAMVAFESRRPRALHLFDEHADQLGLLAVQAQRDAAVRSVFLGRGGDLSHEQVEVAEVVGVGHRISAAARRVRREIQPLVEHVVFERSDPLLADEPVDLAELLGRHHADVVAEIGVRVSDGGRDHLGKDGSIGAALVEIVLPGAEVADDRGDAANQRRGRLAPRVGGQVAVDPDVEVRVHRARKDQPAARVDDRIGLARGDRVDQRGDAAGADAHVAAQGAHVGNDDRAIQNGGIVAGNDEGVRSGERSGPVSAR